ncbi:hypothetical protein [Flavobacterium sp. 3HN19-14]|uniref:hypothetical protein n=1 Tax=Flavobacterium sp. 3HN19-14 TaxID=3448133 RepID=UPI003EE26673
MDPPTVSISYPALATCADGIPMIPIVTGSGDFLGGIFSSEFGLQINPVTGEINPSASAPGTYNITYTVMASGEILL